MIRTPGGELPKAKWWHRRGEGEIRCDLCPHRCLLTPDETGLCGVRRSSPGGDVLVSLNFGLAASMNIDPVEKKPLYHWHPGTGIFSVGSVGCNLRCPFCQNWELARWDASVGLHPVRPEELPVMAEKYRTRAVAFTYNEPVVWYEFVLEASALLREKGYDVVLVTNGTINPEPLKELLPNISAANVDLKAFSKEAYGRLGGYLEPVMETIRTLKEHGVHVELTHLLVPGLNTERRDFERMVDWIGGLDKDIPFHLSRYFPRWKYSKPATPAELMEEYAALASKRLNFVYQGNVHAPGVTRCPGCGRDIVVREGYNIVHNELDLLGNCRTCGRDNGFIVG